MSSHVLTGAALGATISLALAAPALAGVGHGSKAPDIGPDIGKAGDPARVSRTIEITMYDNYYEPASLDLREGETVRFVVLNAGEFVHEFNIATPGMHEAHRPEMVMMMEHGVIDVDRIDHKAAKAMQASFGHGLHDEPNSVLLEPGQTGEVIWQFPDHAGLEFACNVPGHYETGMTGPIKLGH